MRIGMGYDVHRLVEGRDLILGGVKIEHTMGLLGHSDADCLTHAIMDALLGAAAMGDIGQHFPDTDPAYEGADSMKLLEEVVGMLSREGYIIGNVDATIIAQKPKMAPHIPEMKRRLAEVMQITEDRINVKATTEEKLGFTGAEQGISCQAICLLETVDNYMYQDVVTGAVGTPEGMERGISCSACPMREKQNQKHNS